MLLAEAAAPVEQHLHNKPAKPCACCSDVEDLDHKHTARAAPQPSHLATQPGDTAAVDLSDLSPLHAGRHASLPMYKPEHHERHAIDSSAVAESTSGASNLSFTFAAVTDGPPEPHHDTVGVLPMFHRLSIQDGRSPAHTHHNHHSPAPHNHHPSQQPTNPHHRHHRHRSLPEPEVLALNGAAPYLQTSSAASHPSGPSAHHHHHHLQGDQGHHGDQGHRAHQPNLGEPPLQPPSVGGIFPSPTHPPSPIQHSTHHTAPHSQQPQPQPCPATHSPFANHTQHPARSPHQHHHHQQQQQHQQAFVVHTARSAPDRSSSSTSSAAAAATLSPGRPRALDLSNLLGGSETDETGDHSFDDEAREEAHRILAMVPGFTNALRSAARRGSDSWPTQPSASVGRPPASTSSMGGHARLGVDLEVTSPSRLLSSDSSTCSDVVEALERRRLARNNYHLTGQAAVELFMRLNHARQTLDFTKRQASLFSPMDRARMDIWKALDRLNELREYEAALMAGSAEVDPDMPLRDHALQTAELCRMAHPTKDWLHLVGLIHGLGKLLAHQTFGSQPQWATCGESFPLGCRFDAVLQGTQFFSVNPDRRRRLYNTPLGIYQPGCGLQNVWMSWSACEYLYMMLLLNDVDLPQEALFILRHQKFFALTKPGSTAYHQLLSPEDHAMLPLLASFQQLSTYKRVPLPQQTSEVELRLYYDRLIAKYIGHRELFW